MKNTILAVLVAVLMLGGYMVITLFSGCEVVDGSGHIFSDQCLPDGFVPDLVTLSARASYLKTPKSLDPRAANAVESLIADAERDGLCLVVIGAYRSQDTQAKLYTERGKEFVARPGRSEHQTGLAVDFSGCPMTHGVRDDSAERPELAGPFSELSEYAWLVSHASQYGFEQSYRSDNVDQTGYPAEEWHWKLITE